MSSTRHANEFSEEQRSRNMALAARLRAAEKQKERGYVYFLRAGNEVKIGFSTDPRNRQSNLRVASAGNAFIARLEEGTRETERRFHKRFAEYHVRGEWFDLRGRLARYLERDVFPIVLPGPMPQPHRPAGHL
jgi:hypothetical protein